ncbi:unnamed protein product [Ceratitis capitata]|uniref:(Mediterranean fruit fly) hypothetical protein n=1 Tax=Ceratitis capitata TaxID=7213 RepID=A0A811V4K3_CERCA|nr:unnamed protein product [Ceratitis capitata]
MQSDSGCQRMPTCEQTSKEVDFLSVLPSHHLTGSTAQSSAALCSTTVVFVMDVNWDVGSEQWLKECNARASSK